MDTFRAIDAGTQRGEFANEDRDCTVRATAIAAQISYKEAHALLALHGRKNRRGILYSVFLNRLKAHGGQIGSYRVESVKMPDCWLTRIWTFGLPTKSVSLARFLKDFPKGRFVVRTRGHVFAVIDGQQYDTAPNGPRCKITGIYHFTKA